MSGLQQEVGVGGRGYNDLTRPEEAGGLDYSLPLIVQLAIFKIT